MHPNEEKDAYFEELYRRFYETLRFLCMRYVGYDPRYMDAVDDCVQETFLTGYQHYEELLKHPNVGGWLTRTCMFRMGSVIRARNAPVISRMFPVRISGMACRNGSIRRAPPARQRTC